jgi:hypothetical protein
MAHRFRTIRKRNTTLAGYGAAHQRERKRRLHTATPHDRCGYCGLPLGGTNTSLWVLPHNAQRTGYLPGLWHKRCNDIDGGKRGNQRQRAARRGVKRAQSRAW